MTEQIVSARWILTGVRDRNTPEMIEDSAVLVSGGVIREFGSVEELQRLAPHARTFSFPNHVMMPGFVNSHHHVGLTPLQVGSPDHALELWLAYRIFERRPNYYLDTLYSAFEMIASGVTTVAHINGWIPGGYETSLEGASGVLKAYRDIGMRSSFSVLARDQNRLVYEADEAFCARLPGDLGIKLAEELRHQTMSISESLRFFDKLREDNKGHRLTRIQLAPANLHWCSDDAILELEEKSLATNTPMHMHLLETIYQKEYARRRSNGKTAVRHLYDLGVLSSRMTLGHGVWLTGEDIEIAADTGTCICHNCSSNFRLRSGLAPLNAFEKTGVTTAIGIDEAGINDDRDMLQELRMVLKAHRVPGLDESEVPTAPQVVRMATEGGSRTTAFNGEIGRLEEGRFFDAVLYDWDELTYPYQDDDIPVLDVLVHRAKTSSVKTVFIDGEIVYRDGAFTKVDRGAVLNEIAEQMRRSATTEEILQRKMSRDLVPYIREFYRDYLPETPASPFYRTSSTL